MPASVQDKFVARLHNASLVSVHKLAPLRLQIWPFPANPAGTQLVATPVTAHESIIPQSSASFGLLSGYYFFGDYSLNNLLSHRPGRHAHYEFEAGE